jgi:antitoxin CptB
MSDTDLAIRQRKLQWHARRGLLELDVMIDPFIREHVHGLSGQETHALEQLFSHEDPDLWQMFLAPDSPDTLSVLHPAERVMLKRILQHHHSLKLAP